MDGASCISLALLRSRIQKEPEAYEEEFRTQLDHLKGLSKIVLSTPQKPDSNFHELLSFISRTVVNYPTFVEPVKQFIMSTLDEHAPALNPVSRKCLVVALTALRMKRLVELEDILPQLFDILLIPDKGLRSFILLFITKDISMNKLCLGRSRKAIQTFILDKMTKPHEITQKRAMVLGIDLYRRNAWRDANLVNTVAECCFSTNHKIALTATNFLIGKLTPIEACESDEEEEPKRTPKCLMKAKKTAKKDKRQKVIKERRDHRREERDLRITNFDGSSILDVIRDPQTFAERLYAHAVKPANSKIPFVVRLALLNCISRLVRRYELILLPFYAFIVKYIMPKQIQVMKILAILVQGCHELVPPESLYPIVKALLDGFVTENQAPEIIAVGLNTLREICHRAPLALTPETLAYVASFRQFRNKIVVAGARSIINLYRDIFPGMLEKSLRGREATMEISRDEAPTGVFGNRRIFSSKEIQNILSEGETDEGGSAEENDTDGSAEEDENSGNEEDDSDDIEEGENSYDGSEDDEDTDASGDETHSDTDFIEVASDNSGCTNNEADAQEFVADQSKTDNTAKSMEVSKKRVHFAIETKNPETSFKKQKLLKKSAVGSTNPNSRDISTVSDEDSDEQVKDIVDPESLKSGIKKKGKRYRLALIREGKNESKVEQRKLRARNLKSSIPESVKKRNKPLLMAKRNRTVSSKIHSDTGTKVATLRKHIQTLKKKTGKKKRYRRL